MPKVSKEYIENKKKIIIDSAYSLCLEKTMSTITMQDIIDKTGFSQGGIYRFYNDIDEIFADMIKSIRKEIYIKEEVDEIFSLENRLSVKEINNSIFNMLSDFMEKELKKSEKIEFELSVLAMNYPERIERILKNIDPCGHKKYLMKRVSEYLYKKSESGEINPKKEISEILAYIASAYSGIQMSCIVNHCYIKSPDSEFYTPKELFNILEDTVNFLLGIS